MNKEFIPYEQALELRELGFNEECVFKYSLDRYEGTIYEITNGCKNIQLYKGSCTAPLYQQAFRWFREKHNLEGEVHCIRFNSKRLKGYQYAITSRNYQKFEQLGDYHTYEEAEIACLKKLIEIVKQK
jgi:hypothetical protein